MAEEEKLTDEEILRRVVANMRERITDMSDPVLVASWAMHYASRAFHDGYTKGQTAMLLSVIKASMKGDINGLGTIAELYLRDAGSGGGASGGGAGASSDGSTRIPTRQGSQVGEGTGSSRKEASDNLRSTRKSDHPTGSGD